MNRAIARFPASPPPPPQHVGAPLRVGELVLLRRPNTWFDLKVELRATDDDLALVRIIDRTERVPLAWLRRAEILR
jgi:hypothetical protein